MGAHKRLLTICAAIAGGTAAISVAASAFADDMNMHAGAPIVLAQAGSTGGTIGKQGKSASGGEDVTKPHHAAPVTKRGKIAATPIDDAGLREANCASRIVGFKWSSWASGLFGAGDTTFNSDGTAMHASGIPGTWRCDGRRFVLKWAIDSNLYPYAVSPDGKRMIDQNNGKIGFTRR